jgi:hypothetical protein
MSRKLLLIVFLLWQFSLQGQTIQNVYTTPTYPSVLDSVKVFADLQFSSGGCDVQYTVQAINNDSIRVDLFHCPGALTVICYTTDSVNLGLLQAGTYIAQVFVHTASPFTIDPCSEFSPVDSSSFSITVLPGSGITKRTMDKTQVYYQASSNELFLENAPSRSTRIFLFNTIGELALEQEFNSSGRIVLPELSEGVYLYRLVTADANSRSGKISISK